MSSVTITEIKQTKRGRYALFCADGFMFSIDEDTVARHHVKKGMQLENEQLMQIRAASDFQKAKNKALDLLSMRDHSEYELRQKLMKTYDEDTAALAVQKVSELKLTDDGTFARRYASELIESKGQSKRAAAQKLREKGISREIIEQTLTKYGDDETQQLLELVKKKYRVKLEKENGRKSVFAALMRKGFSSRDIKSVLNEIGGADDNDIYEEF
ncbi:MAG: RecX family transcriptional regulator [Oscillospiraceae bacterium]